MSRTALYRHFDASGRLLYVGISISAMARLAAHEAAVWFDDIARVDVERHPSRDAALTAERHAIRTEKPLHNIAQTAGGMAGALADTLGRRRIAEAVGVGVTAVSNAVVRGQFPASWYFIIRDLCSEHDVECPRDAFGMKAREDAGAAGDAA